MRMMKKLNLEFGLIIGFVMTVLVFLCDLLVFMAWAKRGYGPLNEMWLAILDQLFLSLVLKFCFLLPSLSIFGARHDTYISDLAGSIHNALFENININETIMTLTDRGLNFHGSR